MYTLKFNYACKRILLKLALETFGNNFEYFYSGCIQPLKLALQVAFHTAQILFKSGKAE